MRTQVFIDDGIETGIASRSLHLSPADDALILLLTDQLSETGSAESVVAGLNTHWKDHYLKTVAAGYLLLQRYQKVVSALMHLLFALLLLFSLFHLLHLLLGRSTFEVVCILELSQKDKFEAYCLVFRHAATGKEPNGGLVFDLYAIALADFLLGVVEISSIGAHISQVHAAIFYLQHAVLATESLLSYHHLALRVSAHTDTLLLKSMGGQSSSLGNQLPPQFLLFYHDDCLPCSDEALYESIFIFDI